MRRSIRLPLAGLITTVFLGCGDSTSPRQSTRPGIVGPSFTLASGFKSTPVARGNAGTIRVHANTNGYTFELNAQDNTDVAVANVTINAGGSSGWHSHPGPVFAIVKTGSVTVYQVGGHGDHPESSTLGQRDATCSRTVHPAGTVFVEPPGHVMNAVNEDPNNPATVTATYLVPAGVALRIDQPKPASCP